MSDLVGSCICGAHTVTIPSPVLEQGQATPALCHCTSCRKASGSLFSFVFLLPGKSVTLTHKDGQELVTYDDLTCDSGNTLVRSFCGTCGSPVRSCLKGQDETIVIRGGLFAPGSLPRPVVELYVKNNEQWETKVEEAGQFEGMLPGL